MLFLFLCAKPTYQINIQGNKRIEKEVIKSYIPEDDFSDADVLNKTLKRLYATDYFKDVKLEFKGGVLTVEVEEQPVINKVIFEGNKKVSADTLKQQIGIAAGQSFSEFKTLGETSQKLEAAYRTMGLMNTKVIVKTEFPKKTQDGSEDKSRIDVIFKVIEGQPAFIKSVSFLGNAAFNNSELLTKIDSKIYSGFKFWTHNHFFFQERLEQDYLKLQEFYQNNGYPDVRVTSYSGELKFDKTGFDLVFSIKEGQYYTFGDIEIDYQHPQKVDMKKLKEFLPAKLGAKFNLGLLKEMEDLIADYLESKHISTVDVRVEPNKKGTQVDLKITIKKIPMIKVRFIHVKGNRRTHERVILDHLSLKEGSFFSRHKLRQSEYNLLYKLGFFEKVKVTPREVRKNIYDIEVNVEEGKTGSTSVNLSYSTYDSWGGNFQFLERNIGGTGNAVQGAIAFTTKNFQANFGFANPRLFNVPDLSGGLGFNGDFSTQWHDRTTGQLSISGNMSYQLSKHFSQGIECKVGVDTMNINPGFKNIKDWIMSKVSSSKSIFHSFVLKDAKENQVNLGLGAADTLDFDFANERESSAKLKGNEGEARNNIDRTPEVDGMSGRQRTNILLNGMEREPQTTLTANNENPQTFSIRSIDEDLTDEKILSLRKHVYQEQLKKELWKDDVGTRWFVNLIHSLSFYPLSHNPNRKFSFSMSMHNSLFLGGLHYMKNDFSARYVLYLPKYITFKATGNLGIISSFGDSKKMRMHDCMALSGHHVHGFGQWGIGPRDKWTREALHGKKYYFGGGELKIPLFPTSDIGANVGGYVNFGNVWDSKFDKNIGTNYERVLDEGVNRIRTSVGCFLSLRVPNFPIRFDWAKAISYEKHDIREVFMVGIDM
ncbi:MAG: outer membrane protein assembly factor BamA [Alphaproteobacteria bacterium]|nr:MAG: outer membrane protein assembly factor BamA [Alphaproteobacteria bacterium]